MAKKKKEEEYKPQGMTEIKDIPRVEVPPIKIPAQPTPTPPSPPPTEDKVKVGMDEKGKITTIESGGKTYITAGLKRSEIDKLIANLQKRTALPAGTIRTEEASRLEQEAAMLEQQQKVGAGLAQQTGQLSPEILAQVERGEMDIGQILGGGFAAAVPGVIGGATAGAIGGAAAGAGVGAIPGAIGGAVIGGVSAFIVGARSNLKAQKQGKVTAGAGGLTDGEKNLRKFVTAANKDPANAAEYNAMFNEQLSYIERDWGILQLDSSGFLKDLSGVDATPQRADYQRFYDTTRPFLISQMQMAMMNPNPSKNLLTLEEMGE